MKNEFALLLLFSLLLLSSRTFAQNYWEHTNGPYGGTIPCLTINSSGYIFAATGKGVCRSTDNGDNWTQVNNGLINTDVVALAVSPSGDIFAGAIYGNFSAAIFCSKDNGISWKLVADKLDYSVSFAINSSGDIFFSTGQGIFHLIKAGNSWTIVQCSIPYESVLVINSSDHIFAGVSGGGIYCSTDNGNSWIQINNGLTSLRIISLASNASGHIFAGTYDGYVFRSTDDGNSWTKVNKGLATIYSVKTLVVSPNGNVFAGTYGGGIFRSTDNGNSWNQMSDGLTNSYIISLTTNQSGHVFAGTDYVGVYRSIDNGSNWVQTNNGIFVSYIGLLATNSSGIVFAGTGNGVYRTTDNGISWVQINNGLADRLNIKALAINSSGFIFAVAYKTIAQCGLYYSTDNGDDWTKKIDFFYATRLAFDSSGDIFAGRGEDGVCRSSDNGETFALINNGLPSYPEVNCLTINPSGYIFAGIYNNGIFRSTDKGDSWAQINNGLTQGNSNIWVRCLAMNSSGYIFIGTDSGVYRSTDNGDSWTQVNNGLKYTDVESMVINSSGHVFIVAYNITGDAYTSRRGIYRSTDNGEHWTEISSGLSYYWDYDHSIWTDFTINYLIANSSGYIFAAVEDSGVFRSVQSTTNVKKVKGESFASFLLDQNYPNPFNPSTTINYSIPKASFVTIKVYDILGNEVAILVNEQKQAGNYDVQFAIKSPSVKGGYASGVFFYRIQAGGFVETKKCVLLK